MSSSWTTGAGLAVLLFAPVLAAQAPERIGPSLMSYGGSVPESAGPPVREIRDPHNGDRWLLSRDPIHPQGPGRLVLAERWRIRLRATDRGIVSAMPVIHPGDRLIVVEHSPTVEASLQAVALGTAATGSPMDARLVIGGHVVRVVALGPGRAAFVSGTEAQQ